MQTKQLANQLNAPARIFCGLATAQWIEKMEAIDKANQRPESERPKYAPKGNGKFKLDTKTKNKFIKLWNGRKHSMLKIGQSLGETEWITKKIRNQLLGSGEIKPRKRPHQKKVRHDY